MAAESLLKTSKHIKYTSYRNIIYHRFFVGLLLFIVLSLVFTVLFNVFSGSSSRTDFHEPVNLDPSSVKVLQLRRDLPKSESRLSNCTYWECFNVYRCGRGGHDKITIYIYPLKDYQTENGRPISQFSKEFYIILDTIRHSKYYTPDPEEACLLVPSIDTLNQNSFSSEYVGRALQSLQYWNNGENHIIFNMLPGKAPNYESVINLNTGKAIIAGGGFNTWSFRYGFDVSIPVYSNIAEKIDNSQPKQKTYMVISTQLNIPQNYLEQLQNIASSSNDLLLLDRCKSNSGGVDYTKRCEYTTGRMFNYPEILKEGMFCLVIRSARLTQAVLMDILASQCIPIVVADSVVMPFNSHVDWNKLSLSLPEDNLKNLLKIVHSVSNERRGELYWQLRWVYDRYFSSIEKITLTTLEIINEYLFPLSARMYENWNMPEYLVSNIFVMMYIYIKN
ncbi:unnamed protein product [Diatraea saccharalis]|uniref:Exostosin GT47 domain-containing protein n=1 Tax=Diatraea saccharalis TaxID=40085 RepID=A0A9N9WDM9_9NEOP|nr:unnamed protein product [Diatraea saccharalis]